MEKDETLGETIKTIVYAVVIAILIRTFLFEPFKIPSTSMLPTLKVGDFLFVSKYTYGYSRHSLPLSIPLINGRVWDDAPLRGEVVVFKFPQDNKKDFIKRVIGLPGDKIEIIKGRLFINDEQAEREQIEDYVERDMYGNAIRYNQYIETLPDGKKHYILEISDNEDHDNMPGVIVPDRSYFMMGDNRDNSDDSRGSVGFVPEENLVGKARFLFYSHNEKGAWYMPWTWPRKIRWNRLFNTID